jgi:hypothetical protein
MNMDKKTIEYKVRRAQRVVFVYPNGHLQVFCKCLGRFDICELGNRIWKPSGMTVSANDLAVAALAAQQEFGVTVLVDHEFKVFGMEVTDLRKKIKFTDITYDGMECSFTCG